MPKKSNSKLRGNSKNRKKILLKKSVELKKKKESKVDKGNPITAFNMYKFIVKIIAFAILVTFAIVMIAAAFTSSVVEKRSLES